MLLCLLEYEESANIRHQPHGTGPELPPHCFPLYGVKIYGIDIVQCVDFGQPRGATMFVRSSGHLTNSSFLSFLPATHFLIKYS